MTLSQTKHAAISLVMQRAMQSSADALAEMVSQEVSMQLETIRLVNQAELEASIRQNYPRLGSLIRLPFQGASSGYAMLIFPEGQDDLLLKAAVPEEQDPDALAALKPSMLTESGNVLLNACVGTMANELEIQVNYDLPELVDSPSVRDILAAGMCQIPEDIPCLMLTSRLCIGSLKITIFILMICKPSIFDL